MHINDIISSDLDIPESLLNDAVTDSRKYVKIFTINKNSGGYRTIYHPSKKLKTIQYWLISNIFKNLPVHDSAIAFRDGLSILDNAKIHSRNKYFLKMDLKDFFPSIRYTDLMPIIKKWHDNNNVNWAFDVESNNVINKSCFYKNDQLAVGYPTSPIISNIVMYDFDVKVNNLVSDKRLGNMLYTRYADDFVFSTNKKNACKEIKDMLLNLVNQCVSPNITINHSKTKFGSSSGGSAAVTGLKICPDGHITIRRKQKDHIRLLLSLYRKGKLDEKDHLKLIGHLSYCHHVAPAFYSSLSKKYFKEIHVLRNNNL